jgi:hypothetical protein
MTKGRQPKERSKVMRVFVIVSILCFAIASFVCADETGRGNYVVPSSPAFQDWMNTNNDFSHSHTYTDNDTKLDDPYGVGLDIMLWQSPKQVFGVEASGRYDVNNESFGAFVVGKVNLWSLITGK